MSDEPAKGTLLAKVVTKFLAGGSAVDVGESVVESFFRDVIGFGSRGGYVGILSSFVSRHDGFLFSREAPRLVKSVFREELDLMLRRSITRFKLEIEVRSESSVLGLAWTLRVLEREGQAEVIPSRRGCLYTSSLPETMRETRGNNEENTRGKRGVHEANTR